jgi:hypothetical protein
MEFSPTLVEAVVRACHGDRCGEIAADQSNIGLGERPHQWHASARELRDQSSPGNARQTWSRVARHRPFALRLGQTPSWSGSRRSDPLQRDGLWCRRVPLKCRRVPSTQIDRVEQQTDVTGGAVNVEQSVADADDHQLLVGPSAAAVYIDVIEERCRRLNRDGESAREFDRGCVRTDPRTTGSRPLTYGIGGELPEGAGGCGVSDLGVESDPSIHPSGDAPAGPSDPVANSAKSPSE